MAKALNPTQLKYFQQRLQRACAAERARRVQKLGPEPLKEPLSWEEQRALIASGKAVLRPDAGQWDDLYTAFDYPLNAEQARAAEARAKYQAAVKAIDEDLGRRCETLMAEAVMSADGVALLAKLDETFK